MRLLLILTLSAAAGVTNAPRSTLGRSVQTAMTGVYGSLTPAQIDLVSAFLNSPTDANPVNLGQELAQLAAAPATAPDVAARRAAEEPLVESAQEGDNTPADDRERIARRLSALRAVLQDRGLVPDGPLEALKGAAAMTAEPLPERTRSRLL